MLEGPLQWNLLRSCDEWFFLPSSLGIRLINSLYRGVYKSPCIGVSTGIYCDNRRIIGRDPDSPSSRSLLHVLIIRLVSALSLP